MLREVESGPAVFFGLLAIRKKEILKMNKERCVEKY